MYGLVVSGLVVSGLVVSGLVMSGLVVSGSWPPVAWPASLHLRGAGVARWTAAIRPQEPSTSGPPSRLEVEQHRLDQAYAFLDAARWAAASMVEQHKGAGAHMQSMYERDVESPTRTNGLPSSASG